MFMLLMNFNSQNKTENKNPHPASLLHRIQNNKLLQELGTT